MGAAAGRKEGEQKKGEVTKRRLVHIFPVKTSAAEGGCGGTSGGSGDDGNLPADILCALRARHSLTATYVSLSTPRFLLRLFAFESPPR